MTVTVGRLPEPFRLGFLLPELAFAKIGLHLRLVLGPIKFPGQLGVL